VEAEGEQDRLEVSSFLDTINLIRRYGGSRGRSRQAGGEYFSGLCAT
jgi:hypothetical protein